MKSIRTLGRRFHGQLRGLLGVLFLTAVSWSPLAALHPNHPLDIGPEQKAEGFSEGVDAIDLYSGALSLEIPLGPFKLNYSSSVWRYDEDSDGETVASPHRLNNAGLGFYLGWGELLSPSHALNPTDRWLLVNDGGGEHSFYSTLHKEDADVDTGVFYSRDNSYLRLRVQNDGTGNHRWAEVEFPNGRTQRFECVAPPEEGCGLGSVYRLRKGWSSFSSLEDPDFEVAYSEFNDDGNPELWARTNRYGLTHKIYLDGSGPWVILKVNQIEIQSHGGQTATYDFTYRTQSIARSCKDSSGTTDPSLSVPLLVKVDLPDGSSYEMTGPKGGPLYHRTCFAGIDDVSGVLRGLTLPTGGGIVWGWQENEFPPGETHSTFNTAAGVSLRVLSDAADNTLGVWRYKSTGVPRGAPDNEPENDPQVVTEVIYPTGHCSKHFFNARYWVTPSQGRGWELGLPFVYTEESAGKFLSTQVWDSNDGGGSCSGNKVRSNYLRFRRDSPPGQAPSSTNNVTLADFYATNRQVEAERTVFHLDDLDALGEERYVDSESTDFDGLGHFRRTVETGNFRAGSTTAERRESLVGFNRSSGTYPGPTYVPVLPSEPWVLAVFDYSQVHEPDALGVQTSRLETSFEDATGFLTCTRVLANGSSRGPTDRLTVMTHDNLGRLTDVKEYGGDLYPGHDTPLATTGEECGDVPAQPDYWISHSYDPLSGVRVSTRPRTSSGANGPFLTYDVDAEPVTGFVLRERDPAGFEVSYSYDTSGRVVGATPSQGAQHVFSYENRTASDPARLTAKQVASESGVILNEQQVTFDDFGRTQRVRRRLPGADVWTEQEMIRNGRGWLTAVSEWGDSNERTEYLQFDALGRPAVVRPPDGANHDIKMTRLGSRKMTVEVKRALVGGDAYTQTVREFDRYGRLIRVSEPSGDAGASSTTTYRYDVGGRLTEVQIEEPGVTNGPFSNSDAVVQTRSFEYDARGFLISETHPEKGAAGNGSVTYENYDAAGLAHGMVDGPHSLAFEYDFMGRPTRTLDRHHASRVITKLFWDGGAGFGDGKLWKADRYNDIDLPWNSQGEERVRVRQNFHYNGLAGAVSTKTTTVFWSSDDVRFKQEFSYDELGAMATSTYPYCILPTICSGGEAGTSRKLLYSRDQDALVAVEEEIPGNDPLPWVGPITYHGSGLRNELPHANGVVDHLIPDDHWTRRPGRMFTTGGDPGFDTGFLSYDGAGNVRAMEREISTETTVTDSFLYDPVGRLVEASYLDGSFVSTFSYDAFGNLQSATGALGGLSNIATDKATNRLQGASYDGAGNLLSAPGLFGTFSYDTSNRLTSQAGRHYLYDAFGERTVRIADIPQEAAAFHLRDLDNHLVSEVILDQGSWSRHRDFIFADGSLVASSGPGSLSRHYHLDHLGSTRWVTAADGTTEREIFYLPYGDAETSEDVRFTGHERDASTGSDYMHARHYHSQIGRFLSVDPILGSLGQPQSWNRYTYVLGNPLSLVDPTGMKGKCAAGETYDRAQGVCYKEPAGHGEVIDVNGQLPDDDDGRRRRTQPDPLNPPGEGCQQAGCFPGGGGNRNSGDTPGFDPDRGEGIDPVVPGEPEKPTELTPEEIDEIVKELASPYDVRANFKIDIDPNATLPKCATITDARSEKAKNMNYAGNRIQASLGTASGFLPLGPTALRVLRFSMAMGNAASNTEGVAVQGYPCNP